MSGPKGLAWFAKAGTSSTLCCESMHCALMNVRACIHAYSIATTFSYNVEAQW